MRDALRQRRLAERIVRELFTNGAEERAQRLVLTVDTPTKRDLGGWGFFPAVDLIERLLTEDDADDDPRRI